MARPLIDDFRYLDAHALWRAHATPADLQVDAGCLVRFDMNWRDAVGQRRTNYFEMDLKPCRYGGVRAYFVCPAEACERRCVRLYNVASHWLCRRCHGFAYYTQRLHTPRRLLQRKRKVLSRVGVDAIGWIKDRPKGMHESTYYRIWKEADDLGDRADRAFMRLHPEWGKPS